MESIVAPLLLFVAFALAAIFKSSRSGSRSRTSSGPSLPPGPRPLPVVGNSHLFAGAGGPYPKFTELAEEYGDVYSLRFGSTPVVVVSGSEAMRAVLLDGGKSFGGRPDFVRYHKLFGDNRQNSLALCDWSGVQIKRRSIARKHCNPRPDSPYKKSMAEIGDFEMREFASSLRARSQEARARGEEFAFKRVVMGTALNLFTQYMCSTRFDAERDREFARVALLFDKIFFEINQGRAVDFFPWLMPVAGGFVSDLTDWSTEIRAFILARIADARELDLDDDERERDFTDGLLKALRREPQLSRDGILFALEDFLGGSSALGNFVSQALLLVALHPETQAKIQAEVDEATGRRRPVTMSDADDLPYATATLRETLRYVSSPIVPHVATETTTVKGHLVEKGTVVVLNNHKLNRDPALWEAPEEFRPERFVEATTVEVKGDRRGSDHDSGVESESESKRRRDMSNEPSKTVKREVLSLKPVPSHFIPFSAGRRTCLGKGLLQHYGLLMIATVLQNFDVVCERPERVGARVASLALPPDARGLTFVPRRR